MRFAWVLSFLIPLAALGQTNDRLSGISTSVAVKPPVLVVSTIELTLEGEQTVNGVPVVTGDRVLVKDQDDAVDNGIYTVDTGDWNRAEDFDDNRDVVEGTLIVSNTGTDIFYRVTTDDPITIGTSEIEFELLTGAVTQGTVGQALYPLSAAESAASVTPSNYGYPQGYSERYGAVCDGVTNDTTALQSMLDVVAEDGSTASVQPGTCLTGPLKFDASNITIAGRGRGSILKASTAVTAGCAILNSLSGGSDTTANQAELDTACGAGVITVRTNVPNSLENVVIRDLQFEGNAFASRGIWATRFTRGCSIANNYFDGIDGAAVSINGSWSFSLLYNHVEMDGDLGIGFELGTLSNGEGSGSVVVNAATIIGNELNAGQTGLEWDFGAAGMVAGNIFEFNDGDGFESQSVVGITVVGNYFEGNGGDNLDMGSTGCDPDDKVNTDCAESWQVVGNNFTQTVAVGGNNIRLDGVVTSRLGPNRFSGDKTQHYDAPPSAVSLEENEIWLPLKDSTYVSNQGFMSTSTNFIVETDATVYRTNAPRLHAVLGLTTASGALNGFYGVTAVDRPEAVTAPVGGGTTDAEARTAINSIIDRLEELGLVKTN